MFNAKIAIVFLAILTVIGTGLYISGFRFSTVPDDEDMMVQDPVQENLVKPMEKPADASVPLPTEADIIRTFFNLINEKRIPDAISMMSESIADDDSARQSWGVQFNALSNIKINTIDPYMQGDWSETRHEYKVSLDVTVSESAKNAPIPYYGWGNNPNIRWITLTKKSNNMWQITEIATGA